MVTNATFVKISKTNKLAQQTVKPTKVVHKGKEWVRTDKRSIPETKN